MSTHISRDITLVLTLGVLVACSQGASNSSGDRASAAATPAAMPVTANSNTWIANGATACDKYLTPDVVSAILLAPAGKPEQLDAHSCRAGSIYISLNVGDIDAFRQELPMIVGTHPLAGVGDGAYWNEAGAVSAVKGHDRGCDISVIGAPTKIQGAARGQKLGEICNKLFALP